MAVTLLGTSPDFGDPSLENGFQVIQSFPVPDGENRILLVAFMVAREGSFTLDPEDYPMTYGGVLPTVRSTVFPVGSLLVIVAALNAEQSFANADIVITNNSGNTVSLSGRARVFGATDTADATLTVFATGSAVNNLVLNPVNVEASGDLLYTFAAALAEGGLVNDNGYTSGALITEGNLKARDAYSMAVTAAQSAQWTATPGASSTLIVAVAAEGVDGQRVMTSPDGINWTQRTAPDGEWTSVCFAPELPLFVAVGPGGTDFSVMTSPDGINWTLRTAAADLDWRAVAWSPDLGVFAAVASSGVGNRVMTSPDGINWTSRTSSLDTFWQSIVWFDAAALFVAGAGISDINRVMTSPDGINWTTRSTPQQVVRNLAVGGGVASANPDDTTNITSGDGIVWSQNSTDLSTGLIAIASNGSSFAAVCNVTNKRAATSGNGQTWTAHETSEPQLSWSAICFAEQLGLYVAVADNSSDPPNDSLVMTGPGGSTWTRRSTPVGAEGGVWQGIVAATLSPAIPARTAGIAIVIRQFAQPPLPPPSGPACDEIGRASRAYVSAYDRTRVHQVRLYRFEKRCLVANFNGAFPPARKILSATWRTDRPEIGVISSPQISADQRETMVLFASQLWGFANLRAEVLLDNGEVYNQVYLVNVREASWYFNDPPPQVGPFSVTVTA